VAHHYVIWQVVQAAEVVAVLSPLSISRHETTLISALSTALLGVEAAWDERSRWTS
jgi:hypothetical protein